MKEMRKGREKERKKKPISRFPPPDCRTHLCKFFSLFKHFAKEEKTKTHCK
jgi:hypothetical protein